MSRSVSTVEIIIIKNSHITATDRMCVTDRGDILIFHNLISSYHTPKITLDLKGAGEQTGRAAGFGSL